MDKDKVCLCGFGVTHKRFRSRQKVPTHWLSQPARFFSVTPLVAPESPVRTWLVRSRFAQSPIRF